MRDGRMDFSSLTPADETEKPVFKRYRQYQSRVRPKKTRYANYKRRLCEDIREVTTASTEEGGERIVPPWRNNSQQQQRTLQIGAFFSGGWQVNTMVNPFFDLVLILPISWNKAADRTTDLKVVQTDGTIPLDLPTHTFKLLHKSGDLLEHALFFGQVLRIKRAHFG